MIDTEKRNLQTLITGYTEALYFTEGGPDHPEFDGAELSDSARLCIMLDCVRFLVRVDLLCGYVPSELYPHLGHDLWLTRNGHGAGFWDGDWPENQGQILDGLAQNMGPMHAWVGDDGLIYMEDA